MGHCIFFYDKGGYLVTRHKQLVNEMHRRGYSTNFELSLDWPHEFMLEWEPTVDDKLLNMARILRRLIEPKEAK